MHKSKLNMVNRLIDKNGRFIEIIDRIKITEDHVDYDKLDPKFEEVTHNIKAIVVSFKNHEVSGDLYKSGDMMLLVKAQGEFTPQITMRVIKDGRDLSIINVEEVYPGETMLYFRIHCRI